VSGSEFMIEVAPALALLMMPPMLPVVSIRKNTSTLVAPPAAKVMVLLMVMDCPMLIVAS
jgi:hypothetical protein